LKEITHVTNLFVYSGELALQSNFNQKIGKKLAKSWQKIDIIEGQRSKRAGRKKKKEKYEGFPRPGGDFVAPGERV
jgi:hypothetical protein